MQKVVGSNPISRLPRLIRPAGKDGRGASPSGTIRPTSLGGCEASSCSAHFVARNGRLRWRIHRLHDAERDPPRREATAQGGLHPLGDAICKNHQSRTRDLESQTIDLGRIDTRAKAHRVAVLFRQQSENLRTETGELQALKTPPADAGTVGPILGLVRAKVDVLSEWAKAYDDHDTAEIQGSPGANRPRHQPTSEGSPGVWIRGLRRGEAGTVARLASRPAPWRSGYAAACKAVYTGSIPVGASGRKPCYWRGFSSSAQLS